MEKRRQSNLLLQCRLCSAFGYHKIDIFGDNSHLGYANCAALADKIFRYVDVRVERDDETTRMCGKCFRKMRKFARFRSLCAATNVKMGKAKRLRHDIGRCNGTPEPGSKADRTSRHFVTQNTSLCSNSSATITSLIRETDSECGEEMVTQDLEMLSFEKEPSIGVAEATEVENTVSGSKENRGEQRPDWDISINQLPITHGGDKWLSSVNAGEQRSNETEQVFTVDQPQSEMVNGTNSSMSDPYRDMSCLDFDEMDSDFEISYSVAQTVPIYKVKSVETRKRVQHKVAEQCAYPLIKCRSRGKCNGLFESWDAMMYHVTTYHAKGIKRKFSCHLCKHTSTLRANLQRHMTTAHIGLRRFTCPFPKCSKAFAEKRNLQRHTNAIHTKNVTFKCTKCPAKFFRKVYLTRHLANAHGQGITFSCYLCKKSLGCKQTLQRHMDAVHMGLRRFKCPFPKCSKSFSEKHDLQRHMDVFHSKNSPYY